MKKVVFILMFPVFVGTVMAQTGTYEVKKFCKEGLNVEGLQSDVLTALYNKCVEQIKPQKVVIDDKGIRFELVGDGVIELECDVRQEGKRWFYDDYMVIEKIGRKKYVVRLKNDSPLMYLSKTE